VPLDNNADRLKGLRNDYKKTFETEEGKKVLKDLESVCMSNTTTFNKDPYIMAFQEGARAVYLHITTVMNIDIENLELFNKEQS
jgi:hypothetical protein